MAISNRRVISFILNISFLFLASFYSIFNLPTQPRGFVIPISKDHDDLHITYTDNCEEISKYTDRSSKCSYVKSHSACRGKGYINYLEIFYCTCAEMPRVIGYILLLLWVVLLFYVLANTSAEYFCPSVEGLSKELKLSPVIAGTILLPFGNGANDVFSSIISFTQSNNDKGGVLGLNSVLGGAFFVSCFVVGMVISVSSSSTTVDRRSFTRDVIFLLFSLSCLVSIIVVGRINLVLALCFVSIYLVYICSISAAETRASDALATSANDEKSSPLIMDCLDEEHIDSGDQNQKKDSDWWQYMGWFLNFLELPLYLPRRLTIPVASEEKWSKPFAISTATTAPILLATLLVTHVQMTPKICMVIFMSSALVGIVLGNLTFVFTEASSPPRKLLLPWLFGAFLMSITWTYLLVEELVALLVSLGTILGISSSILGLTILAWGNSVGDLVSNVTMARHGGENGAQIAISGCYAGPLFNILIGLGVSLALASWSHYPSPYVIPGDSSIYEVLGFFVGGLVWALVMLPKSSMKLNWFVGAGLFFLYFCFLFIRLLMAFK